VVGFFVWAAVFYIDFLAQARWFLGLRIDRRQTRLPCGQRVPIATPLAEPPAHYVLGKVF